MDDIIVRLARTLACEERLQILSYLVAAGERPPTEVARELGLSPNALSGHLSRLGTVGLIKRRRSGGWSYCVAESPYNDSTLSGRTLVWLRDLLATPRKELKACGCDEPRNISTAQARKQLHNLVFEAATAFTDLRRLQILRYLARGGEATAETFSNKLKMSAWAVARHTDKLIRRGYLGVRTAEGNEWYRLAESFKTPIHRRLWEIVRSSWDEKNRRSS